MTAVMPGRVVWKFWSIFELDVLVRGPEHDLDRVDRTHRRTRSDRRTRAIHEHRLPVHDREHVFSPHARGRTRRSDAAVEIDLGWSVSGTTPSAAMSASVAMAFDSLPLPMSPKSQ